MSALLRWWLFTCIAVVGGSVAYVFGFWGLLNEFDKSRLGWAVVATYSVVSLWIGMLTYHARNGDQLFTRHLHVARFFGETMMAVGICGTLIGFLHNSILLRSAGAAISDISAAKQLIVGTAGGLGLSSIVTLLGVIAAIGIRAQVANLEYLAEDVDVS